MATKEIKDFSDIGSPDRDDFLLICDSSVGSVTKKVSIGSILDSAYEQANILDELADVGSPLSASTDDVLLYNGSQWTADATVVGSITLNAGSISDLAGSIISENIWNLTGSTITTNDSGSLNVDLEIGSITAESFVGSFSGDGAGVSNVDANTLSGSSLAELAGSPHSHIEDDITDLGSYAIYDHNHDSEYYTETEVDNLLGSYYTDTETDSAISTAVSNLVDSAPGTLDTLNELASALGDDPDFATTISSQIGTKADIEHTHIAGSITDFDTEVSNNSDVSANTTHRSSNGTDHSYINQDVTSSASPTFAQLITTGSIEVGSVISNSVNLNDEIDEITGSVSLNTGSLSEHAGSLSTHAGSLSDLAGSITSENIWDLTGSTVTSVTGSYNIDLDTGSITGTIDATTLSGSSLNELSGSPHSHVEADISDFGTYEPSFSKNTGFNLNLGSEAGSVVEGTIVGSVLGNTGSISLNTGSISLNTGSISLNTGSISLNTGSLSDHAGSLSTHAGSLSDLAGSISSENIWDLTGSLVTSVTGSYDVDLELGSLTAGSLIGDGSSVDNVDAISLSGSVLSELSGSPHTHVENDISDLGSYALYDEITDFAATEHTHIAGSITDFDTEVSNNTDVAANTTHRSSNGTDHSYIDQDVTSAAEPTFANLTISGSIESGSFVGDGSLVSSVDALSLSGSVLADFAEASHSHDDLYYTETEIDNFLGSYYTDSETDSAISTAVSNLVDSAPGTLDTLNELASALGDDPDFATTVSSQIGTKADNVHTHIETDITDLGSYAIYDHDHDGDYLAIDGTADNAGSLDNLDSTQFMRSDTDTTATNILLTGSVVGSFTGDGTNIDNVDATSLSGSVLSELSGSPHSHIEADITNLGSYAFDTEMADAIGSIAINVTDILTNAGSLSEHAGSLSTHAGSLSDLAGSISSENIWDLTGSLVTSVTGSYDVDLELGSLTAGSLIGEGSGVSNVDAISLSGSVLAELSGSPHSHVEADIGDLGSYALYDEITDFAATEHTHIVGSITDFETEVQANGSVVANTTHRSSDGTDHTYIDQDVTTTATPTFANIDVTGSVEAGSFIGDGSGLTGVSSVGSLNDLGDVIIDTPGSTEVLSYDGNDWINTSVPGGLAAVVDDTTPELGGDLDGGAYNIVTTGSITAGSFIGDGTGITGVDYQHLGWTIVKTGGTVGVDCDYTSITSAISGGATHIFIKDGTYSESISLSSKNYMHFIGESHNTIIQTTSDETLFQITNSTNIKIENLKLQAMSAGYYYPTLKINGNSSDITLKNCWVRHQHSPIYISDYSASAVSNIMILHNKIEITSTGAGDIIGLTIMANDDNTTISNILIDGNTFEASSLTTNGAICLRSVSSTTTSVLKNVRIINNIINSGQIGVHFYTTSLTNEISHVIIANNDIICTSSNCIQCYASASGQVIEALIIGNYMETSGTHVSLTNADNVGDVGNLKI